MRHAPLRPPAYTTIIASALPDFGLSRILSRATAIAPSDSIGCDARHKMLQSRRSDDEIKAGSRELRAAAPAPMPSDAPVTIATRRLRAAIEGKLVAL